MKNKGFTLIELLAVIVILAIIALIATPIIINIINDSRESSYKRSIELYGKTIEDAIATYQLNNPNNKIVGSYKTGSTRNSIEDRATSIEVEGLIVNYNGSEVECEVIEIYDDGTIYMEQCTINNYAVKYTYGTSKTGAYTNDGRHISWDELVNDYGLDIENGFIDIELQPEKYKNLRDKIIKIVIPEGVTIIGKYAFAYFINLESVEIPNSVIEIGESAFEGCISLTSIHIPNSVTIIGKQAFMNCTNLVSIEISNGVTSIGEYAFSGCEKLTSIHIPESVKLISSSTFSFCSSLNQITVDKNNNVFEDGDVNALIHKKSKALYRGSSNTIIPNSVERIEVKAFSGLNDLTTITIPNNVTYIRGEAFRGCTNLTTVNLSTEITKIEAYTFDKCESLTTINIPKNIVRIEVGAFRNSGLTSVNFEDSSGWWVSTSYNASSGSSIVFSNSSDAAQKLKLIYRDYYFNKS